MTHLVRVAAAAALLAVCAPPASAQSTDRWHWMSDGVAFINFNHQDGDRGDTQVRSQNWIMANGQHKLWKGQLFVSGMISLEPVTVGARGYAELFQMGEAYQGLENIDRQHPHDMFSQLAVGWRAPLGEHAAVTLFGAPVGEATLGPVAFMHRLSASENPTAPLAHHTLDSTHIAQGVAGMGIDVGPFTLEGSGFHGREPDEYRYGITPGALDSWATRLWFRPSAAWVAQVSYGYLHQPEQLEPGNIRRSTASLTWTNEHVEHAISITAAYGRNKKTYTDPGAFLGEAVARVHRTYFYTRIEVMDIETEHLLFPTVVHKPHPGELIDRLDAYTFGGVQDVLSMKWMLLGLGSDVTFYNVPDRLHPSYGDNPFAVHVFARIRPAGGIFHRMWNMTMTEPMKHSGITMR
jgi:hypothetical protein